MGIKKDIRRQAQVNEIIEEGHEVGNDVVENAKIIEEDLINTAEVLAASKGTSVFVALESVASYYSLSYVK